MASSSTDQVLIVGAGPIGLALACQCLRLGLRVRIIDKQPGPSTTSKAMALQFLASEVLACMGLADRFLARSTGAFSVNLYSGPRKLLKLDGRRFQSHSGREAFSPRLMLIPQSETEAILGEAVLECGGKVLWGTELLDFRQDDDKVVSRLRMADGQEQFVESQWLVSCEGAHTPCAEASQNLLCRKDLSAGILHGRLGVGLALGPCGDPPLDSSRRLLCGIAPSWTR